jgi:hypothetical protein
LSILGASKGGRARAEKLTPEERSAIARRAVEARWAKEGKDLPPQATHDGVMEIGNAEIPCYVLENGVRIVSTRGIMKALGRRWRGRKYSGTELPVFLEAKNLKAFITNDLSSVLSVVEFRTPRGVRAEGFQAELLPMICETYLRARDEGVLTGPQTRIAKQAEILMRGLAHVGIIALVDEATGYQEVRDRFALQEILDKYLRKEFAAWAKRFPDEFYREIFRLRGWVWKGMRVNRPQCVAAYTKNLVYGRLAPGILKELEARNPMVERGHRRALHHQWLTEDVGHPALAQHLHALLGLMRASDTWQQMMKMVNRAFPKRGDSLQLELFKNDEGD